MKNTILLIVFIGSIVTATAQGKGAIEVGGNLGLNLSNVSNFQNDQSADIKVSFNVAGSFEYYFSDTWGIKTKLIYDRKGWSNGFIEETSFDLNDFDPVVQTNFITTDYNLDYLTIPVMANVHFGRTDNWYFNFGPYVGFLLDANITESDFDVNDAFNTTDVGLAIGIGVKIPLNDQAKLFFEYEGQSGFIDVFEQNNGDAVLNRRSAINAGLLFTL